MASVRARNLKSGEVWIAVVKLRAGRWHHYQTKIPVVRGRSGEILEGSRRKAQRAADGLQAAEDAGLDPFRVHGKPGNIARVSILADEFLRERRLSWAKGTGDLYARTLRLWLEEMGDGDVRYIGRQELLDFREKLIARGARSNQRRRIREVSAVTINIHARNLHAFFVWCGQEKRITDWQIPRLRALRVLENERIDYYRPNEIRLLLAAAGPVRQNGLSIAPFLAMAILTGMRRNELLNLNWSWLDWGCKVIALPASQTKSLRRRVIPMGIEAAAILSRLHPKNAGKVFPGLREDITKKFQVAARIAGIRKLRLHNLRDTAAVAWLMQGKSLRAVQQLLGHASIETTAKHYTDLGIEELDSSAAVRSEWRAVLSDIGRLLPSDCFP